MADRRRPRLQLEAFTAADELLNGRATTKAPQKLPWQTEAWELYDLEGAAYEAAKWTANALSRVRLFAADPPEGPGDEPQPLDAGQAVDEVERLGGGIEGRSQILADVGTMLTVPGIGYVAGWTDEASGEERWEVFSPDDVESSQSGRVWKVAGDDEGEWITLPDEHVIFDVIRRHKRKRSQPDSPVRHALRDLWEAQRATDHIDASLTSRLSSAGLLMYPQEVRFPQKPGEPPARDQFAADLIRVAEAAIRDRRSPAARVPLVVPFPGDWIEKVRLLMFDSPLDAAVVELRDKAVQRAAVAMDMPAEILLGMGDVNHWGQWFIKEEALQGYVIPLVEMVVGQLTVKYLRPALPDGDRSIIWYDVSEVATKPDKSTDAIALADRLYLTKEAAVREAGLDEGDIPEGADLVDQILRKAALDPMLAPLAWPLLGVGRQLPPVDEQRQGEPPQPAEPAPRDEPPEEGGEPEPVPAALVAGAYPIVNRALEVAGNRVRSELRRRNKGQLAVDVDCDPNLMHTCVSVYDCGVPLPELTRGAWRSVPEVAQRVGMDAAMLTARLDELTQGLLRAGEALTWEALEAALA
jgi:hypothetical protein